MSFIYPTVEEIKAIEAVRLPNLTRNRPIFGLMPIVEEDTDILAWEQKDSYFGLQQVRGLGGQPSRVKGVGGRKFRMDPGFYGEYRPLDEQTLMNRRQYGSKDQPVKVDDMVMGESEFLQTRYLDRLETTGWKSLQGTFQILGAGGLVVHEDTFPVQTSASTVGWSDHENATVIGDLQRIKPLGRGKGVSFGRGATAWANMTTVTDALNNRNPDDLYGKKDSSQSTITGLDALNKILVAADCAQLAEWDGGYADDNGVWHTHIPDGVVIVVGVRASGGVLLDYVQIRNVNNPNMEPGQYTRVIDKGETTIPRVIEVHNGHNGGPRIYFPGSIVNMDVEPGA